LVRDWLTRASGFSPALAQLIRLIKQPPASGTQQPYTQLRNFIVDIMAEGRRKNTIHLLCEAEVTPMQHHLARYRNATGQHISLTTYIAKSLACTVDEDRAMHAYRQGRSKVILFDEVDLAVMIERDIGDSTLPVVSIVRAANRKPIDEMHSELKAARNAPLGAHGPMSALEKRFFELPALLRKFVWFFIRRDPNLFKQLAGTVGVTSLGMHASGPAVVVPITPMTLTLSIGTIGKKLVLENGSPVEHEIIQLNLSADHDLIDGAPLVRFIDRFRKKLENGCVLDPSREAH
jgi:pyruvate/2-oxoglutarate dehydrogenase complex dihydrolipoamide acyltransferase (E2) component